MRRGQSEACLVVGVDKPEGMTSHDVVNACRRIFGERRVGHTGTLDPLATGALVVCVGPATRLDAYMVGHDKTYDVRISFGVATDTDDRTGEVLRTAEIPADVCDPDFAASVLLGFLGKQKQMPPAYSAIKKGGVKACDAARSLDGVSVACMLREQDDVVRGSLRAKGDDIDVAALAREIGGGGHKAAAGFTFKGTMEEALEALPPLLDAVAEGGAA